MSLRARLLAAIGLVALIALIAADLATYSALRSFLYDRVDQTLQSVSPAVGAPGGAPAPPHGAAQGGGDGEPGGGFGAPPTSVQSRTLGLFVERLTASGTVEFKQAARQPGDNRRYSPAVPAADLRDATSSGTYYTVPATTHDGPAFRLLVARTADGDRVVVGQELSATEATLHQLVLIELAVTAAAVLASLVIGFWLVRVGLKPLAEVEDTAEAIAAGQLDRRVPGDDRRTEVGRLARVLNTMLGRIQAAFAERDATETQLRRSEDRLRRFVADASHELRTPLAAVSAYAELYQRGGAEHPEDLSRIMSGIRGESARMKALVEDLLLLARLDEGRPLERAPVALVPLVADAVAAAQTVGPEWPVRMAADRPVEVAGDAGRLRQVIDNLLSNVRSHTPRGTTATVTVTARGDRVRLQVADDGPGLDPDEAAHIFERFYRTDRSRARSSGGAGLGLSIVGAIVAAHGGTVQAAPNPTGGAVFTVELPAANEGDRTGDGAPAVPEAPGTSAPPTATAAPPAVVRADQA